MLAAGRTARWNPLADVHDLADAQRIAAVIIPKPKAVSEAAIWYEQVRAVVARIMLRLVREGRADLTILAAQLAAASVDELRAIVAGTPAGRAFEPGADKAASSVAFMLTGAADIIGILASVPDNAPFFSFDKFYQALDQHEGAKPFVFLAAPSRARESAAPVVTAWVDAAAAAILQRPIDTATNAWLMLDEVASLPPIQSLLTLLPLGRKYHACITLAFQSIAQLRQTYGNESAEVVTGQTATQGDVDPKTLAAMLDGTLPDGTVLGTVRNGVREHVCGWDMTLSAPKSVSVMALVAGDRRLLDAQARAVDITIAYVERNAAATRIRQGDEVEPVATGKLAVANFPHITARETERLPDPQLHDHDVVLNVTQDATSQSRSIDSRPLYRIFREAGGVYHQALAFEIVQLGYTVSFNADGTFEIDGVPLEVRQHFSGRSAQIEAELAARGKSRKTASVAEKATIALDTRSPKEQVNQRALVTDWRARADSIGFTEDVRRTLVADAEARAAGLPVPTPRQRRLAADQAVASGAAHLAERESVFPVARLERAAGDAGRGRVAHADILAAITRAERRDHLVARDVAGAAKGTIGFTTRDAIQTEQAMLAIEAEGRDRLQPLYRDEWEVRKIVAAAKRRSADHGHSWAQGPIDATKGLLQSPHRVTGIQGSAGTAKTTTVLATYADAARAQGLEVRALAPLATAADVLGDAISAEPMTIARMLIGDGDDIVQDGEVWVVDEASMAGARDTEALLARAREAGARVVLVGDVDQLGSVEAGRAFGQLQDAGMKTFKLDEIVRQAKGHTRTAVEAMLARDAGKAFAALDAGIQQSLPHEARDAPSADRRGVREYADTPTRHAIIARDFAQLSREERANTLVLDPRRCCCPRRSRTMWQRTTRCGSSTPSSMTLIWALPVSCGRDRRQRGGPVTIRPICSSCTCTAISTGCGRVGVWRRRRRAISN
ncbi:hypothetical protein GCM10022268_00730 [Sphingomonas cynarae]|uniref:TrwC relaxase domain-containing protein n=1 Tax=Sphingomonas cynarae TaxID=930197 RepID=A0ABP7CN54_9SPHN